MNKLTLEQISQYCANCGKTPEELLLLATQLAQPLNKPEEGE